MKALRQRRFLAVCAALAGAWLAAGGGPVPGARAEAGRTYEEFSKLCVRHFGAKGEPEAYRAFGEELKPAPGSLWTHVSESSACIAWQTNLPSKAFVEYGPTASYGRKTAAGERPTSLHVHYLRDLKPNTTYHWRWVAVDERGRRAAGKAGTFRTRRLAGAVRVPGDLAGPPYVLDKADTTYLVTKDISADGTAIFIAASGITLDLGGHTVTYDRQRDAANQGACGVRGHKTRGIGLERVTVVNGVVRRGPGGSETRKVWDTLYMPIFFSKPSRLELAGLTVRYHGCQVVAMALIIKSRDVDVHHNVFRDEGTALFNRHVGMDAVALAASGSRCHHNLIQRTRHRGIQVASDNEIAANEIYVDSYATNSYGIMYYAGRGGGRNVSLHHNRIFGTGYHPVGIGSGQGYSRVKVYANYIRMQGTKDQRRWRGGQGGGDPAGQIHPVNGIRLQKPGRDIEHSDNVVVVKGSGEGCWMRGLWLVPGETGGGTLVFRNNRVKLIAEDARANGYAISAGGAARTSPGPGVKLIGNTVVSNLCHVQFGDNYSHGGRYDFAGNTFIKVGRDPRYRTIRLGWRGWKYETYGHVFTDTRFEGGASYDSVSFDGARRGRYDFTVRWTLTVKTSPAAAVSITDSRGTEVFSGKAQADGKLLVPLAEYVRTRDARSSRTPHTVTIKHGGKTATKKLTMTQPQTVELPLPSE